MKPLYFLLATISLSALAIALMIAFHPRPLGALRGADANHQCQSSETYTCGPAACVSAYSWIGVRTCERAMCIACHTTNHGSTGADIAAALDGKIQPMPLSAPGRTFVVFLSEEYPKAHVVCAHGEADGWTVNDPALDHPQHWTAKDFMGATGCVEVKL